MKYFIDLDNTLCYTEKGDYENSQPILQRIESVNALKDQGHHITIWTARGAKSGNNYVNLTMKQLKKWNVKYDILKMDKPDYNVYIDDKSFHVDTYWPILPEGIKNICDGLHSGSPSQKQESVIVKKGWGKEIIFANNSEYCGKILAFEKGKKFSMHFHVEKKETWYVAKGAFVLYWIQTDIGKLHTETLQVGDVVTNERGAPHQLMALEDSEIFEVSTQHKDEDSYRVWKGD
jgi:quercetin dioxygenase-like cupin family protein